ncbi:unnamed protein product, partial [Tuber aestivum]
MSRFNHNQHSFPRGSANLHSSHETDGDPGPHNPCAHSPKPWQAAPPNGGNPSDTWDPHSSSNPRNSHPGTIELSPNHNMADFAPWPPPADVPTCHGEEQDHVAGHSGLPRWVCNPCKAIFKRQTDLDRHFRTSRRHSAPSGPACRERGCRLAGARFTRVDNFKAHYRKQHGKTDVEADIFIREWKAQ